MAPTSASAPQLGQTMWKGNGSPGAVSQSWRGAHWWQVGQRASGIVAMILYGARTAAGPGAGLVGLVDEASGPT